MYKNISFEKHIKIHCDENILDIYVSNFVLDLCDAKNFYSIFLYLNTSEKKTERWFMVKSWKDRKNEKNRHDWKKHVTAMSNFNINWMRSIPPRAAAATTTTCWKKIKRKSHWLVNIGICWKCKHKIIGI